MKREAPIWPVLKSYEGEFLRRVKMPLGECGNHYARALAAWTVLADWPGK